MFFDTIPRRRAPVANYDACLHLGPRAEDSLLMISQVVRITLIVSEHAYTQAIALASTLLDCELRQETLKEQHRLYHYTANSYWDLLQRSLTQYLRTCVAPRLDDEAVFHLLDTARPWYDWVRRGSLHQLGDDSYGPCTQVTRQAKEDFVRYLRALPKPF